MGVDEGNLQVKDDVDDVKLENCPITILFHYDVTYYLLLIVVAVIMVFIIHTISYIICDSRSKR